MVRAGEHVVTLVAPNVATDCTRWILFVLAQAGQVASKRTNKENVFLIFHLDDHRSDY
jgi:hypothetical protein